jgi:hypothetical protein
LRPQQYTEPPATAQVWSWLAPIEVTFCNPTTRTGTSDRAVPPVPSCPKTFVPQHQAEPSFRITHLYKLPRLILVASRRQLPPALFGEQKWDVKHPVLAVQLLGQALAAQTYPPAQAIGAGGRQVPFEQLPMPTMLVPEQLGAPHAAVGNEHRPSLRPAHAPAQTPAAPHDVRLPCGAPDATAVQVPSSPGRSHAMHDAAQALLQQ